MGICVEGSSAWVSDRWVSDRVGLSQWLFFFFLFKFLVVMRLWVCDLVVILEGCFFFFFFQLLVVNGNEVVGLGL